jgi:hypothetical protein
VAVTERGGDSCVGRGAVFDVDIAVVSKLSVIVIGVMVRI